MENSGNSGKVIGALLIGAAIGGVLGVLFAPDKGSETRKKMMGKADDLTGSLKDKFNKLMDDVKKEFAVAKQKASEFAENGRGK